MKKLAGMGIATAMALALSALLMVGLASAGSGKGFGGGSGPITRITAGSAMTITGTVVSIGFSGLPYQVDTGTEVVNVYGFGPARYWADLGIDPPMVGEEVMIEAIEVTFSDGSIRIIAVRVTVGDETVVLRDVESAVPLWRGDGGGTSGRGSAVGTDSAVSPRSGGRDRLRDGSCLTQ